MAAPKNTPFSIRDNFDGHLWKHNSLKISTDAAIMISTNLDIQNVHFSMRDNLDPCSNGTEEN
jgi:hypothetical protein